ncbi:MAG: FIST C-terminal domain-containing protein [Treponema sp.]|jgi:hypothetical protein|nr:FIST C-terminal domain-containing protein [Treponema sp.]
MIKMLTAWTCELDNPEKATQDILDQVDIKNGLLKNTVGLLFCQYKFIDMNIVEALCKALPFDVLGATSMFFGMAGQEGEIMLTLAVLTSDDTEFATGLSETITVENVESCLHALYEKTVSSFGGGTADLIFAFPPTLLGVPGDIITGALDRAGKGLPVFGTIAVDLDVHIRKPKTIFRGATYSDRLPLLLFKGPVKPKFFFLRFPEKSSLAQDAVITEAKGSKIISINNKPALGFLREVGLFHDGGSGYTHAIPLVMGDSEGENLEVLVVQDITAEGTLVCGRQVAVGAVLNIGAITSNYVLESALTLIKDIKGHKGETGLFIISCFLRSLVLREGSMTEFKLIQQELGSFPIPYLYLNSGGELCPKYLESGETENQALQYAIVACQF